MTSPGKGLTSAALRWLAISCMLVDHIGLTLFPEALWLRCVGRLSFPIFAFQTVQGYLHTASYPRYRSRLLVLALVSEVPFDLMVFGVPVSFARQNAIFTLLLGLLAVHAIDGFRSSRYPKERYANAAKLLLSFLAILVFAPDYGWTGVMTILMFYLLRGIPHERLGQLLGMIVVNALPFAGGAQILGLPVQSFAVLALAPIWLYSSQRGRSGKPFRLFSYLFYPVHMLILYWIAQCA